MQEQDIKQEQVQEEPVQENGVEPELPNLNLQEELEKAQAKASENYDLYIRARAETDNVRRRASEDVAKARKFGIEKFAESLLPVVDSMEKALAATKDMEGPLREGVLATHRQMLAALESNGLECDSPLGQKFDPNTMQAIAAIDSEQYPSGQVAEVFQNGWKLSGRVLRPAMVAVSK